MKKTYGFLADGARPPAADVTLRIPPPRALAVAALLEAVIAIVEVAAVVVFAIVGVPIMCVVIGLLAVAMGALSLLIFRFALVPAVITRTALATPAIVRGWTVVPLHAIAGAGLRYVSTGSTRSSGWVLFVWRESGDPVGVKVVPARGAASSKRSTASGRREATPRTAGSAPPLDWDDVAGTAAGRAATGIAAAVIAAQGPNGLLATARREQDPAAHGDGHVAFWSPAGVIGALDQRLPKAPGPRR